jgi:hypothetical protein
MIRFQLTMLAAMIAGFLLFVGLMRFVVGPIIDLVAWVIG